MRIVDLSGLPQGFMVSFNFYDIYMTVIIDRKKMNNEDKKLTRVVSTKLSMEDDNFLQQVTTDAYRALIIKEITKSALVPISCN